MYLGDPRPERVEYKKKTARNFTKMLDKYGVTYFNEFRRLNPDYPIDFKGRDDIGTSQLQGINLSGVDISGMDLNGCDLTGAHLRGAKCHGTSFFGANLDGVSFFEVDLTGARFGGTVSMEGTVFYNAVLKDVHLCKEFGKADLSGADLRGAKNFSCLPAGMNLRAVNLSGTDLGFMDLRGTDLSYAKLIETGMWVTKLDYRTRFVGAVMAHAKMTPHQTTIVDLSGWVRYHTLPDGTVISGIDMV